ncbi:MAG: hypothetical protein L0228_02105 [Planctomycetes bacterium]|nr:hypothetical protein [Planctomycetota bacterium]
MASRLRLFVKKRGSRRTGARWPGLLGEALLFIALIAIGAYGLHWLIGGVLLAEGSRHGWWLWLAIVIPLALVGYGATELVMLLWRNLASTERRAAAVQKAIDWEIPVGPGKADPLALPSVPPVSAVTDSPGTRLAYRLPIDAASGWMSFTMAAVCLVWNTLVVIFVYRVVQQHIDVRPNRWLLTWLMVPFVMAGALTLVALVRQVLQEIVIGTTRVEVSHHPFYPGGTFQGFVSQTGRLHVRWFQVQLACEEQAVYQQGTDTRRATSRVYSATALSQRRFDITPQQAFEATFDLTVPETAMHSFVSGHNAVVWTLVVRGRMARWGEFERHFPIYVYPVRTIEPTVMLPLVASARS